MNTREKPAISHLARQPMAENGIALETESSLPFRGKIQIKKQAIDYRNELILQKEISNDKFQLAEINTWRLYNKYITQQRVIQMVESWESHGFRFGSVCIDDGWTFDGRLGDWTPDPVRFPDFRELVEWIHGKGYAVRLWVAPAQIHEGTDIFKRAFPEDVLKNKTGVPAYYQGLGTYRLDPRSTVAKTHIADTMRRLAHDYRVDAFKVDFPPFYEIGDSFYQQADFDLEEGSAATMIRDFYQLVHDSASEINPRVRICGAKHISECQPFFEDIICGDLAGQERTFEAICTMCKKLRDYSEGYSMVPWLEMVWGEGSDTPSEAREWWAGYLEFIAHSINFGLKIEHSFLPFDYPNVSQIRTLTNLYGPRNTQYKVLAAGRYTFPVEMLREAGVTLSSSTRFLVAPENTQTVTLHTGELGTSALQWQCRNVLNGENVLLRGRNEFWGTSMQYCSVQFEARQGQVYELWHEGETIPYYLDQFRSDRK